jgi:hypothetical protein
MIPRNVAIVLENQKTAAAAAALTDKDKKEIQKKGAETFVKKEFGLKDKEAAESAAAGIRDAAPEVAKAEKTDPPTDPAPTEHKHWWSSTEPKSE